ncbi:MAG: glycosyl hydrolase 53 family protein [Clostridiales bacterium]|nr:glycosyl hydrolase 53 family protein [Clostridiales bacterium]
MSGRKAVSLKRLLALAMAAALVLQILPALPGAPAGGVVQALSGEASYEPVESDLTEKSWVSVSSSSAGAGSVIDGDAQTVWKPAGGGSLTVDLGGAYAAARKVKVVFESAEFANTAKIEGSSDGSAWTVLGDHMSNQKYIGGYTEVFDFAAPGLRYVRLTVGDGTGVSEMDVLNYLRGDLKNGSDMSELGSANTNSYYYNRGNNPPVAGVRGGQLNTREPGTNAIVPTDPDLGENIFGLAKDMGWAVNRLRIWNEPVTWLGAPDNSATNCSPENTAKLAKYVVGSGLELAIDFHYSDTWADPQHQQKPAAWAGLSFDDMVGALYDFTFETIDGLVDQGTAPTIVAIGNEISNGMMWGKEWPDIGGSSTPPSSPAYFDEYGGGVIWKYWHKDEVTPAQYREYQDSQQRLALLVDAGIRAIEAVEAKYTISIDTEVHCAFNVVEGNVNNPVPDSEKLPRVKEFITQLTGRLATLGSSVERIGISYYPDWHGSWKQLEDNIGEILKIVPGTKINISESSPRNTGVTPTDPNRPQPFQSSVQSQGDDFAKLMTIINDVPDNLGQGVWSWGGTGSFQYGPVNFTTTGSEREPFASMKVFKDAIATNALESEVYVTHPAGSAPILPATVKSVDAATGEQSRAAVAWDAIDASLCSAAGAFSVSGVASTGGNMKAVTAYVTISAGAVPGTELPSYGADERYIDFNDGWRFYLATRTPTVPNPEGLVVNAANSRYNFATYGIEDAGVATSDAIAPGFDDGGWRELSVPHDWSIEGEKVASGSNSQGYMLGGLGWYRKTFTLPESLAQDKRISIDFEGVYQNSVVYVNGHEVGNYPSGYTGFAYDITQYLNFGPGTPNTIAVKVQAMAPSGRWYTGAGITRPGKLVVTNLVRVARNGLVLSSPNLETTYGSDGSATLNVSADIYSDDSNGVISLVTTVYDAHGGQAAQHISAQEDTNPSTLKTLVDSFTVPSVNLWTFDDPYRYTVKTEVVYDRNGGSGPVTADTLYTKFGFRWAEVDPQDGFFLNGEYAKLHGVDLHHDSGALGAAANYDAFKREMTILKEMGVNAYRTSHNPPAKEIIDVCSELGIVVMEEAYDGWGSAKATYDFGAFFMLPVPADFPGQLGAALPANAVWSDWVTKEMALRDVNEPSVVMWSIGNEVRGVGTRPDWYDWNDYFRDGAGGPDADYVKPILSSTTFNEYTEALRLRNDILDVDATRYVVMGGDQERTPPAAASTWGYVNQALDGFGLNYNTAPSVDGLMAAFTDTFFFESESSSQTGARGVYFTPSLPNTPANQTPGNRGSSSYDNNFASWTMPNEYGLKKDRDREGFAGQFIWSGFDYIGEPTPFSVYPVGVSSFGTVDTAGFPKDSFYLFQSQWAAEPMAHIVPMNWNDYYVGETVEVWANTNAYKAELFLNNISLGEKAFDKKTTTYGLDYYETTEPTYDGGGSGYKIGADTHASNTGGYVSPNNSYGKLHLTWQVTYAPGELVLVAKDELGSEVARDTLSTAKTAYTLRLAADREFVAADGRSLAYVTVEVVDEDGNMLPSAGNLIKFDVEGNGAIAGVDNGKQESAELYKWGNVEKNAHSERSAYNGKALVILQSGKGSGDIVLTAAADGLVPATLTIPTNDSGTSSYEPVALGNVSAIERKSAIVAEGSVATALPVDVAVTYESGVTLPKKVAWDTSAVIWGTAGEYTAEGTFEDVSITLKAQMAVSVANAPTSKDVGLNAALGNNNQTVVSADGALATASFTGATSAYPNNMLNGDGSNSWLNYAAIGQTVVLDLITANSRPYDWVETYWPEEQALSQISLYFGVDANYAAPGTLNAMYWDGFEWVDAASQTVTVGMGDGDETKIEFDPVLTRRVRVGMVNSTPFAATGRMKIYKFETYGPDFDAASYEISYDANGGMGSIPSQYALPGKTAMLNDGSGFAPPAGKQFVRWDTQYDGLGTPYGAGGLVAPAASLPLFAIWDDDPGWEAVSVAITPASLLMSTNEMAYSLSAVVNGSGNPSQQVTWSVIGAASAGTVIEPATGRLQIAADETSTVITVRAEWTGDASKYAEITVVVLQPTVSAVAIAPAAGASVNRGGAIEFSASVTGGMFPQQDVLWEVVGATSVGTAITQRGRLLVGEDEAAASLTVRATSALDAAKSASVDVAVTDPPPPIVTGVQITPASATLSPGSTLSLSAAVLGDNINIQSVAWAVEGNSDPGTEILLGWGGAASLTVGSGETSPTVTVRATSNQDSNYSGTAEIAIRRAAGVAVAPDGVWLARGESYGFSATVSGVNPDAVPDQAVVWSVSGATDAGTSISAAGVLTVGAGESGILTLRAAAASDPAVYGEATARMVANAAAAPTFSENLQLAYTVSEGGALALRITAASPDGGTLSYQWHKDGAPVAGATGSALAIAAAAPGDAGDYFVVVTNTKSDGAAAQAISNTASVAVGPSVPVAAAPVFGTDLPASVQIAAGGSFTLYVEAASPDGGQISYQWYKDGTPIAGETGQALAIAAAGAWDAGNYYAVATNTGAAGATAQATSSIVAVTVSAGGDSGNSGGGNGGGGSASSNITPNTTPEPTPTPSPSPEPEDGQQAGPSPTPAPTGRPGQADGTRTVTGSVSGDEISGATHSYQIDVTSGAAQVSPDGAVLVDQGATADIAIAGGGAVVKAPGGTVVSPDGRIAIPVGSGGALVMLQDGSSVSVPQGNVIFEDGDTPLGFAYAYENPFIDVAGSDWFYDAVKFAVENALFNGTSADMFSPGGNMTRAMTVTVLYRMEGQPGAPSPSPFEDVPAGEWYSDAVAWGAANGIVNGFSETRFGGGEPVTREQLAAILLRYAEYKGKELGGAADISAFADAASVSGYALEAVQWAVGAGLIQGRGENDIAPQGNATRAEVAAIIQRFMAIG